MTKKGSINLGGFITKPLSQIKIRRATPQIIPNNINTQIVFDTIDFDTVGNGIFAPGSVKIFDSGIYAVTGFYNLSTIAINFQLRLLVNGRPVTKSVNNGISGIYGRSISTTMYLYQNDLITMEIFTSSGETTSVLFQDQPFLEVIQNVTTDVLPSSKVERDTLQLTRVSVTSPISIPAMVETKIIIDDIDYDQGIGSNVQLPTSDIIIKRSGLYRISGFFHPANVGLASVSNMHLSIFINGVKTVVSDKVLADSTRATSLLVQAVLQLQALDAISLSVFLDEANVSVVGSLRPFLEIEEINDKLVFNPTGTPVTSWKKFPFSLVGSDNLPVTILPSASTIAAYRVEGKMLHLSYSFKSINTDLTNTSIAEFEIPPGFIIDDSLLVPITASGFGSALGYGALYHGFTTNQSIFLMVEASPILTRIRLFEIQIKTFTPLLITGISGVTPYCFINCTVPIR